MASQNDVQRNFRLFVTHVDGDGPFLKISGQLDKQCACMIESLIESSRDNFDKGIGAVPPSAILEGIICAAKYKDGAYYRAKVISTTNLATGLVGVHFIDYGNKDIISLSTIRFLDNYDPLLLQLRGQATDYYLAKILHRTPRWEEQLLLKLQSLLCYSEYPATVEANTLTLPLISVQFQGNDLSAHLISNKYGIAIPVAKQEVLHLQLTNEAAPPMVTNWQPNFSPEPVNNYTEHVPFFVNQSFPSNPASAMRLQQNVSIPYNGGFVSNPSAISQRLLVNKVPRTPVSLRAPMRQPQVPPNTGSPSPVSSPVQAQLPVLKAGSPKKSPKTYKCRTLEENTQHKVFVSYAEEGPELFAVQLATDAQKLQDMMDELNRQPHRSLTEPPMIGTVCLGRMSGDRIICRAIVMNLSGSQCKLFFIDFGDTEMVSYYDIFDIPEEFVKPNVFAMRFCLSGVKNLVAGPHLNEAFKQLVNGKVLTLRVVHPEGPPLIQYGELYIDNKNVLDLLLLTVKESLQFQWMGILTRGSKHSVLVSYVDSCLKFYIQLSDKIDELNAVMDAVKAHCERTSSPGLLPVGAACCARFPDDDNWYRARIRSISGSKITVAYVDYGNEQEVEESDLRTITTELIQLPAQAMKCALKGYEDKPVETKTSNQLEMLALEKTLMAHIMGVLSGDTMLVSLIDDTVSPPLDVARKMAQLSQPRSNHEPKATTPIRKDAPENLSSPEGSVLDDSRKKGFRREKSFKDERRGPREGNEDFGQRGGSFRGRDNKDSFDRSGPGRHSEKFGGKPDRPERGDRRDGGGRKPWENNAPISASEDQWDETPSQPAFSPPPNKPFRDNRDKRKPRPDQPFDKGQKPAWKSKNEGGVSNRLKMAADGSNDAQTYQKGTSVQDRLRRDNKFNKQDEWEEKKNDNWESNSRPSRERPERRDFGGDRRDNWGDKKENSYQKRDFRENRSERGDRGERGGDRGERGGDRGERGGDRSERGGDRPSRSNFTPRERADRSFGSEGGKKDRNFGSQDRSGRAPPFKSRSKFTEVQYKELPNPVALEIPFTEPSVDPNAQHEVSVTWIISPDSFYTQILSLQPKFLDMMHTIPEMYKGVKPFTGIIPVGASVLAKYPEDGVLYRATIISVQPFGKYIVQYIDFGNKFVVDTRDIWQLDQQLMELPKMAVHCSLLGVAPKDGEWKANSEIDLCFNAPRYQCVFQECVDDKHKVSLWNNGASVADMLIEKELALASDLGSSVTLKDEAIDLTIIVGQQILCRVTHVESFEKFYVQLDLEKALLVESAIADYDTSLLTPLAAESLADGIHCTVRHEDKIYRAILIDVSDSSNVAAVLPDYGMSITTALDKLMILPTELSVYYYQSLECCLNNYTEESKTLLSLEELKTRITDKKLIAYINDVDGIRLVTTLYEFETGQKVAIFEPDDDAYGEVVQLCTRAVFNYNFGLAYISHMENLNELYLQKVADGDRIAFLLDEMYKFYEEGTPEPLTNFEADAICVAHSSDGNWYRATILEATEAECKVQFPDYGNTETIAKDSLKKLDIKFYEPYALALVVGLGLVALQDDAIEKLKKFIEEKEVQVTLSFGADGWLASLHLDGIDLSMKLVNEKLAAPQAANEEQAVEAPVEEPISLPAGCTQVYISHIDSPGQFWLQMSDKIDKIEEIQAELQANADNYVDVENREMGTLCIAKYLADEQWYRAEILDADSDITTVRFIDYGNTDVLDNQPGLLKVIPDNLKEVERYAVKSSVNAVPTGTGQWSEPASDYFTQLVGDFSAPVDALIVLKDVTTYVDIFVNGQNLTDKLVSEGHATRSEETECGGDLPSCFASHVNSPSEFWIQLETATPDLQSMEAAMVDAENFPELTEKEEGVICAAKYPEDGAWYRAQVIVDGSEGTEVLFMDYGNASIATELRNLPDELKAKPALSRKCALQKPRDIKSWSRQSEAKFNELAAEGATIFNVQFIASGDISIVELYLEGKSVTEEMVSLCEEQTLSERPTPVGQDLQSSGKICHSNSLEEFYVNLDSSAADIGKVMERMIDAPEFESAPELKVGSLCAAFWAEDEQWYRAKILEFCDVGSHVQFIDYGNKAKCEEFRQLPEDMVHIESLAKCCRLAITDASENAKKKFEEYVAEGYSFQIEFLDTTKEPLLVRLTLHGEDISNALNIGKTTTAADISSEIVDDLIKGVVKETINEKSDSQVACSNTTEVVIENEVPSETIRSLGKSTEAAEKSTSAEKDELISQLEKHETIPVEPVKSDALTQAEKLESIPVETVKSPAEIDLTKAETDELTPVEKHETIPVAIVKSSAEIDLTKAATDALTPAEKLESIPVETVKSPAEIDLTKAENDKLTSVEKLEATLVETEPPAKMYSPKAGTNELVKSISKEKDELSSQIEKVESTPVETVESGLESDLPKADGDDLDSSLTDLNESLKSNDTVIENKSFEASTDTLDSETTDASGAAGEDLKSESAQTPEKDLSASTLESSNDTIKTPERDDSNDSINTDTGYTTSDHEKSPVESGKIKTPPVSPEKKIVI